MGIPVLMVTHRMKEVMSHCDDISILNGGELVYHGHKSEVDEAFIVSKMIRQQDDGVEESEEEKSKHHITELWGALGRKPHEKKDEPALAMENLVAKNLNDISFSVQRGEILGIIGNPDSGVRELPQILGGDMPIDSGRYLVDGEELPEKLSPRICYQKGVNVLPCDRPVRGGIMSCTLRENIFMPNLMQFWNKPKLSKKTMELCVDIFDVQPRNSNEMLFGKFSGGNQQKAIMAKWLSTCPKVFVLDDPTYGVDPASRLRIFDAMREAAEQNVAMIVFSTEPEQLAGLCSRVLALRDGKIVCELKEENGELDRNSIARWCYT
jgi:ribose transport system ATP-binding protein